MSAGPLGRAWGHTQGLGRGRAQGHGHGDGWRRRWLATVSFAVAAGLTLALSSTPTHAALKAWLDSNQVAPGDSVQLTLEYEGQTSSEPDLTPLERDFDVLGSNRTTTLEILNGSSSAKTQLTITLSPKHAGRLIVPALAWDGQRSSALELDVSGSAAAGSGSGVGTGSGAPSAGAASRGRQVFLETQFAPSQPYVQAAVTLTVRLYTREALYSPRISFSGTRDVVIRQVGADETGSVSRGGQSYEVVTRHYVLFPQHSGHLSLPGPELDAQVALGNPADSALNDPFAGFFGPTPFGNVLSTVKPIRLHGDPIALDVRPRPAGAVGSYWMPASEVTLQSVWHPASLQAQAGDPVTIDLDLQAVGLTAAQLPDLSQLLQLPAGLKAYPDEAKLSDAARGVSVVGTRTQSIALIADQPGRFTIPALRLEWWDTRSNQAREVTLPPRTLVVAPAAGSPLSTQSSPSPQVSAPAAAGAASAARTPAPAATASSRPGAATAPTAAAPASAPRAGPQAPGALLGRHLLAGRLVWVGVSAALALAWLVTLGAWLRSRKRVEPASGRRRWRRTQPSHPDSAFAASQPGQGGREASPGEGLGATPEAGRRSTPASLVPGAATARAAFRLACRRNEAAGARRHLLAWVRAAWPESAPTGLNALAKQVDDPSLAALIQALDRACYAGEPWSGEALDAALADLPRPKRGSADQSSDLAPLYR